MVLNGKSNTVLLIATLYKILQEKKTTTGNILYIYQYYSIYMSRVTFLDPKSSNHEILLKAVNNGNQHNGLVLSSGYVQNIIVKSRKFKENNDIFFTLQ